MVVMIFSFSSVFASDVAFTSGALPEEEKPEELFQSGEAQESEGKGVEITEGFSDGMGEKSVPESGGLPIIFENGIHYVEDPAYPGEKIILFCMNNKLHWPHHTEDMGEQQVPEYVEGYLTPDDFSSQEDYEECMRRLSKILYAGYPYNGERLYKIVDNSQLYIPTEAEFNKMLIVPPALQKAFPYLGYHAFTYQDWLGQDEEHLNELSVFISDIGKLYPDGKTDTGLTYSDVTAMPFFKAALCMLNATDHDDPRTIFSYFYPGSYFVTEQQAYNATQDAVWRLLDSYGIPDNNLENLNHDALAQVLYTYSERGSLLKYEPVRDQIHLTGNLDFTYNPKDGLWHSGVLRIEEPQEYHGIYHLNLPQGMTAQCDNLTYVYGNEEYELVLNRQPLEGETFTINAEFVWLKDYKQYSPKEEVEVKGKKFQHMAGAVIRKTNLSENISVGVNEAGGITVTKEVLGEEDCQEEFFFKLCLPSHKHINGLYGDLEFHNGTADFTLKQGQTVTADNLPANAVYEVTEVENPNYKVQMTNGSGTIQKDIIQSVIVTNTKCPALILSKEVAGEAGDQTKPFSFLIELKDASGMPVNETFPYIGSQKPGVMGKIEKPADGTLIFQNGFAEISLSHGKQITLLSLPPNATFVITEKEGNEENYQTTYNGSPESARGTLDNDTRVDVVNTREFVPDTGVRNTGNSGVKMGIAVCLGALAVLLVSGRICRRKG